MSDFTAGVSGLPAPLLVEQSPELPIVHLSISERTGASEDPEGKEGLTRLLVRLMRRTGGGRMAQELDTRIDSLGAALGADVSVSTVSFNASVIARNLDAFTDVVCDVLARPGLGEDELERIKRETVAGIVESRDNDRSLVRRWFQRRLFAGHAYGRSVTGRLGTISELTGSDVRELYAKTCVADNLLFAFAGDIDDSRARAVTEKLVSALPRGQLRRDPLPEPVAPKGRNLIIVDKPERTQTQILIGSLGSHPRDPDHVALHVGNTVLGGTFTARLMNEIRSKRGWSYGAYSSMPYDRHRQAFSMWTFPKADDAASCIRVELDLLSRWCERGISERELRWAKRYLTRSHAFAIDTASKRVGMRLDALVYDLPAGYHERYLDHVRDVTLDEVNAAIRARISPRDLWISVVGTESEIGDAVRDAIDDLAHHEVVPFDED
jgi:zinc protease